MTNAETPQHIKQPDSKSASSKCAADAETGTRSGVQDGVSSYQQSHSTEDAAGSNYAPITHQPPSFSSAIARYQHYLKSLYKTKPTPVDDKLFIGPCAQYINLAIIKKERLSREEADQFTRATLHGGVDQILCQKEQVHFKDIFVFKSKLPLKCILVEGPPGIGKSTFAWELCRQWDELETMQQYSLVVLIKLREKRVQNCRRLSELLNHPSDPLLGQAVVDEILEGEGVLLILDGLDEFPSYLLKEDSCLVRQLISGSCLPKATVVVTSRPSAKISFELCQPHVSKHIEIVGYTEEDRVKYAESVFSSQPDMLVHFLKYIFSNPTIKTMMYIPLHCAIVAQIYKECGGARKLIPRTMTQLYTALCRSLLRRYLVENGLLNSDERMPTDFTDLPQDIYERLCSLSKIAHDGTLSEKLVFYKHELPEGFEHMGFMSECRELFVDRGMETSYNFLHLSLQEYLTAWHISQLPSTHQRKFFEYLLDWPLSVIIHSNSLKKFEEVRLFLAGLTGLRNAVWQNIRLFQFEKDEVGVSPRICRCLFEAQNYIVCQEQLCSLVTANIQQHSQVFTFSPKYTHSLASTSISAIDFYSLGYCVVHSRGPWRVDHGMCADEASANGAEALEMLVNGMRHESIHRSPTGLITELKFCGKRISTGIAWLKEAPQPVLSQLSVLALSKCDLCPKSFELLAQAIVMMPNLHSVDVSDNCHRPGETVPESLIESLSSLKHLECLRLDDTNIDSHDALKSLTNLIRNSNTLRSLHVGNNYFSGPYFRRVLFPGPVPVLKEVIPSAIASRSLQEFGLYDVTIADMIQLSFLLPTNSSITSLIFNGEHQRCNDVLAYLSRILYTNASLTSITWSSWCLRPQCSGKFTREETIAILNDALKWNTCLRNLKLEVGRSSFSHRIALHMCGPQQKLTLVNEFRSEVHVCHLYPLQRLAHQLRRGPSGPQLKLKRAQSLPCLSKLSHSLLDMSRKIRKTQLSRGHSAPDLTLIESISSLHPSLTRIFNIDKFNCYCVYQDDM